MELRQLRYFVKAAESLSFSEAAKIANVAQSTLSQQIRQLEDELGVRLFERSTHAIRLTEAGREVLPAAQRTLHDADQCADRIRDLRNLHTGRLNIGVTYSFSPILAEVILSYIKVYPDIKLNVFYKPMAELMDLLDKREVDFVLAFKPSHPLPDVESHILFQNRLSAVVGLDHPLAARTGVTLADLERYDLALPARGLQARNAFDALAPDISRFQRGQYSFKNSTAKSPRYGARRGFNLQRTFRRCGCIAAGCESNPDRCSRQRNGRMRTCAQEYLPQTFHEGIHSAAFRVDCRCQTQKCLDIKALCLLCFTITSVMAAIIRSGKRDILMELCIFASDIHGSHLNYFLEKNLSLFLS